MTIYGMASFIALLALGALSVSAAALPACPARSAAQVLLIAEDTPGQPPTPQHPPRMRKSAIWRPKQSSLA